MVDVHGGIPACRMLLMSKVVHALTLKRLVVCLLPTSSLLRGRGSRTMDFLVNVVGTTACYLYSYISMAGCILSLNGIAEAWIQPITFTVKRDVAGY
ncbi:hypothetical protein DYB36_007356 [Aphanomyces astaci]|uniref:Uncharacterized protein n=1 Tax=Aphanomyces astaci TaxID=112090 RepID=A0A397A402_APHAT|nr:hypothetical protein DYB36_007356 [Aphanomyces astaci]